MLSYLAKLNKNKNGITKRVMTKRINETSLDAETEAKVRKDVLEAEARIRQANAPIILESITACVKDVVENIISTIETLNEEPTKSTPIDLTSDAEDDQDNDQISAKDYDAANDLEVMLMLIRRSSTLIWALRRRRKAEPI